jgi:hypothetical protein
MAPVEQIADACFVAKGVSAGLKQQQFRRF